MFAVERTRRWVGDGDVESDIDDVDALQAKLSSIRSQGQGKEKRGEGKRAEDMKPGSYQQRARRLG